MLEENENYKILYNGFSWNIPDKYNIGYDICDRWADRTPENIAIIDVEQDGSYKEYTFLELKTFSNKLANAFKDKGLCRVKDQFGERIGVILPQCIHCAIAHIAISKIGGIAVPLFTLFQENGLLHRLRDSETKAIITDKTGYLKLSRIRDKLPDLEYIISIDGFEKDAQCFTALCADNSDDFLPFDTNANDPALLIYTSGTTGLPKGALHAHRVLLGHLPGFEMSHNFFPKDKDTIWTPADWAWIGGLLDVLMPALHHGMPVVAYRFPKFDPEAALNLIKNHNIRNAFLPPTALKLMKQVPNAPEFGINMRSVGSGGETLGAELIEWGKEVFGTTINEFYGQTECNLIVSSCSQIEPISPGKIGYPVPGHIVDVIDPDTGIIKDDEEEGEIAVLAPDPVMFLGYWNNNDATKEKFIETDDQKWLLTGDIGIRESDGKIKFVGRNDDIIASAGYRIGPGEIEDCLLKHPAVQMAGVIGKPDKIRGTVVAAYIKLANGYTPSEQLKLEISNYVKGQLAAYEYPRHVYFIDEFPLTATGKIRRTELRSIAQSSKQVDKKENDQHSNL